MFIIEEYSTAVVFCFVTMICWGSWANTQKLATNSWRFELFYWDYVFGIVLTSLLFALTLGSVGEGGRSFAADLSQADVEFIGSALLGARSSMLGIYYWWQPLRLPVCQLPFRSELGLR